MKLFQGKNIGIEKPRLFSFCPLSCEGRHTVLSMQFTYVFANQLMIFDVIYVFPTSGWFLPLRATKKGLALNQ